MINQKDKQGRKQGYWEETFLGITWKGHYVDNKKEGLVHQIINPLLITKQFKSTYSSGHFKGGKPVGVWNGYYEDGERKYIAYFMI